MPTAVRGNAPEPFPLPASSSLAADRPAANTGLSAAAAPPPAALLDRAEAVAAVVDRLAAARDSGLGALASVAVPHRDFGPITVSFADTGSALDVSLAAVNAEDQRALAAAVQQTERTAPREATPQPLAHNASPGTGSDRGGNPPARDHAPHHAQREAERSHRPGGEDRASPPARQQPARAGIYV